MVAFHNKQFPNRPGKNYKIALKTPKMEGVWLRQGAWVLVDNI